MKKNTIIYALIAICLVSNIGWWVSSSASDSTGSNQRDSNAADFPYLSKRIFAENQNDILINFQPLRKQLESKVGLLPPGTQLSFYFEYLPSGTSIRIGDNNNLVAASLLKVPMVMNLYKASELRRINLDQPVKLTSDSLDNSYGELWKRGAGSTITLRDAARLAVAESDNTASRLIFSHLRGLLSEDEQSFAQLDIDQDLKDGQAVINAKSYTSVLKSLYFASYVDRTNSQQILDFLSQSSEHNRLTAQLPTSLKVAHKNGVYNSNLSESDCGIVYQKNRPYVVCVMVGLPGQEADRFIAETSKIIHDYIVQYK